MTPSLDLGVSYYGCRDVAHARRDLERIAQAGCTFVVHTFSEADLTYHRRALAEIVAATHALGLTAWADPWGVGGVFGGESPSLLLVEQPEAWEVLSDGSRAPKACLNQPAFRRFMGQWVASAAALGVDGIFWDEPHTYVFQGSDPRWGCWCATCQTTCATWGLRVPGGVPYAFLRRTISEFLREGSRDAAQRGLRCGVCVYPLDHPEVLPLWEELAAIPEISIVGTDPYWRAHHQPLAPFVGRWAAWTRDWAARHGKTPQLWVPSFGLPAGCEPEVAEAIGCAMQAGIRNIAVWSFDCGRLIDRLHSDNPRAVWKTVTEAFKRLRAG